MAKKKGIDVNSVILIIVVVLVVGLSLGIFYKAPVGEAGEGELAQMAGGGSGGDGFCKDNPNPVPCFNSKIEPTCCPETKPYCTLKDMRAQCVPPNSRGSCKGQISCGKTCCNGICLTIKKGFRSTFEKCCPPGTYLKEDNGEYTCESVCKPNEIYDSEKRKCEGKKKKGTCKDHDYNPPEPGVICGPWNPINPLCCAIEYYYCGFDQGGEPVCIPNEIV